MDLPDNEIIVEVLDSTDISATELEEFKETEPIKVVEILQTTSKNAPKNIISEEVLIQKFVTGESDFPDCYTTFDPDDDDEQIIQELKSEIDKNNTDNFVDGFNNLTPSTSFVMNTDLPKEKRQQPRKRSVLSTTLQGLMGEANLCFVRGNTAMAEKICLEIIRQNPLAPEPFFTLAEIYEHQDSEKFLNFLTIAAHLDPNNRDQWIRISDLQIQKGNLQQARVILSKAIKCLRKDYELRLRRGKVNEMLNDNLNAMITYLRMLPLVPPERGELCLVTAKKVARYFYESNKKNYALEAMRSAYNNVANLFSTEDINLLLELLILNKDYFVVLTILKEQQLLEFVAEKNENQLIILFCIAPDTLLPDLRTKLCVSLIHLKAFHLLNYLIENVLEFIPIENGIDWYIDIAEALMQEEKFKETLDLLKPIVKSPYETPPYILLRIAESYLGLQKIEEAIQAYYTVVEQAPFCYDAKFTLSALLKKQGRHREAIKALEQDMNGDIINPRLLYERCLMLKTVNEMDQYLEMGYIMLARHSVKLRNREEILTIVSGITYYNSGGRVIRGRLIADVDEIEQIKQKEDTDLTIQEEFELFKDLIQCAFDSRQFGMAQKLCFAMATTKRFKTLRSELEKMLILASLFNEDSLIAFVSFREILNKNWKQNNLWNFLSLIVQKGEDLRYHRYLKRFLIRIPHPIYLKILLANYHLYCSSLKYALNIYVPILHELPDPLLYLCTAVVFNQLSVQKKVKKKPSSVAQSLVFAKKYADSRIAPSTKQEVFYNLARIHHQAGLLHMAMHYYEEALKLQDNLISENEDILGLSQECAYNLHLIYKENGNFVMARQCLYKYIVV